MDITDKKNPTIGIIVTILMIGAYFFFPNSDSDVSESGKDITIKDTPTVEKKTKSSSSSKTSSKSKYTGYYNGNWEGFVLNQYNKGSASFDVSSNGSATLRLNGSLSATHKGKVRGDKFITTNGQSCPIVDMGSGFKIVLIWTSVNIDVNFY